MTCTHKWLDGNKDSICNRCGYLKSQIDFETAKKDLFNGLVDTFRIEKCVIFVNNILKRIV